MALKDKWENLTNSTNGIDGSEINANDINVLAQELILTQDDVDKIKLSSINGYKLDGAIELKALDVGTYTADEIDAKIDEEIENKSAEVNYWNLFQEYGQREDYQGMDGGAGCVKANSFGGCKDKYIYPKYPLHPVMAYGMFHMCENLVVAPEVDFSQCTNMSAIFHTCSKLKKVGRIESYTAPNATYLFIKCPELETIEYINIPMAQNFKAAFNECEKLKNIRFAKGSIRCTKGGTISFYYSPLLTADSIDSIFDGLGKVSGNPTIQFDKNGENKYQYDKIRGAGEFQKRVDEANIKGWTVWPDENH